VNHFVTNGDLASIPSTCGMGGCLWLPPPTVASSGAHKFPGFRGEFELHWTVAFLGQSVTRKGRVVYSHTPEWEYSDLHKNAPYTGWDSSSYRIEMQAEPIEHWDGDGKPIPGTPYWVSLEDITENDVLPNDFWEAVVEAIDAKCKAEDAERRRISCKLARPSRR
jgi:hypothetical protein